MRYITVLLPARNGKKGRVWMARNIETVEQELSNSFNHWDDIRENGCTDPFYYDGVNINLVRNHIIYYKHKIEEEYPDGNYPAIYYRETPPKMPNDFMAKPRKLVYEILSKSEAVNTVVTEQLALF